MSYIPRRFVLTTIHYQHTGHTMTFENATIGTRVVRTTGASYVIGDIGTIIETQENGRVCVHWDGKLRTWVSPTIIEDAKKPYVIEEYEAVGNLGNTWVGRRYVAMPVTKILGQIEVNVAFALCAGTITLTPHTTVTGNIHTAINDEHGVIVTFPTNEEAQEFINMVYDLFVTTAQTLGCAQHR